MVIGSMDYFTYLEMGYIGGYKILTFDTNFLGHPSG